MNMENMQKLVDALRSGEYEQVSGTLRKLSGYCCLGVACDISGLGAWEANDKAVPDALGNYVADSYVIRDELGIQIDADHAVLPRVVAQWLDIELSGQFQYFPPDERYTFNLNPEEYERDLSSVCSLSELNDNGFTFEQIADILSNFDIFEWHDGPRKITI